MIAGHAMVAFGLTTLICANLLKYDKQKSLQLGVVVALFAILPDIDILYPVIAVLHQTPTSLTAFVSTFWTASGEAHRLYTHSYLLSLPAIIVSLLTLYVLRSSHRLGYAYAGIGVTFILIALNNTIGNPTGFLLATGFIFSAGFIAYFAKEWITYKELFVGAVGGLFSHPIGDLFTGKPPVFLYPLRETSVISHRLVVFSEPVLNFLFIFGLELLTLWIALTAYYTVSNHQIREKMSPSVGIGVLGIGLGFIYPIVTLADAYRVVYPIVALGIVIAGFSWISSQFDFHSIPANIVGSMTTCYLFYLSVVVFFTI